MENTGKMCLENALDFRSPVKTKYDTIDDKNKLI